MPAEGAVKVSACIDDDLAYHQTAILAAYSQVVERADGIFETYYKNRTISRYKRRILYRWSSNDIPLFEIFKMLWPDRNGRGWPTADFDINFRENADGPFGPATEIRLRSKEDGSEALAQVDDSYGYVTEFESASRRWLVTTIIRGDIDRHVDWRVAESMKSLEKRLGFSPVRRLRGEVHESASYQCRPPGGWGDISRFDGLGPSGLVESRRAISS